MGYLHHKGIIHKVAQIIRNKVSKSSSSGLEDKEHLLGERKSDHHRLRPGQCGEEVVLEVQEAWRYCPGNHNMIIVSSFRIMSLISHISIFFLIFLIVFLIMFLMGFIVFLILFFRAGWKTVCRSPLDGSAISRLRFV